MLLVILALSLFAVLAGLLVVLLLLLEIILKFL